MRLLINVGASALVLAIGIGGLIVFGRRPDIVTTAETGSADGGVLVETVAARRWDLPLVVEVDGEASTWRVLTVGSEIAGRIARKPESVRGGMYVREGDVLFEIDASDYELEVERLTAQVQQAEAELAATAVDLESHRSLLRLAEEDLGLRQKHLRRMESLHDRGAATDTELDMAAREELTARNAVQSLRNQIATTQQQQTVREATRDLARAQLDKARLDVARCTVRAPISGRVVDDLVESGDFVMKGDPLLHISDSSRMEVKCSLPSDDVAWIWQQGLSEPAGERPAPASADPFPMPRVPCEVAFEFEGTTTVWDGYLARYEGTGLDRETRMFPCRIVVDQPRNSRIESSPGGRPGMSPPTLLSGMYVSVRIPVTSPSPLVQIPVTGVRPGEQVWVCRGDVLEILSAKPAKTEGDSAWFREDSSGLRAGDAVVVSPLAAVTDGMKVRVAEEALP